MGRLRTLLTTAVLVCLLVAGGKRRGTVPGGRRAAVSTLARSRLLRACPRRRARERRRWTLDGGATLVAGNESFQAHSPYDRRSLLLPAGSSATTAPFCVGLEHPTIRFFARNGGSLLSPLKVEVLFRDVLGVIRALPVGVVVTGSRWQPSLPMPLLLNVLGPVLAVDLGATTTVRLRFTPLGRSAGWQIDDVYVDPFRGR